MARSQQQGYKRRAETNEHHERPSKITRLDSAQQEEEDSKSAKVAPHLPVEILDMIIGHLLQDDRNACLPAIATFDSLAEQAMNTRARLEPLRFVNKAFSAAAVQHYFKCVTVNANITRGSCQLRPGLVQLSRSPLKDHVQRIQITRESGMALGGSFNDQTISNARQVLGKFPSMSRVDMASLTPDYWRFWSKVLAGGLLPGLNALNMDCESNIRDMDPGPYRLGQVRDIVPFQTNSTLTYLAIPFFYIRESSWLDIVNTQKSLKELHLTGKEVSYRDYWNGSTMAEQLSPASTSLQRVSLVGLALDCNKLSTWISGNAKTLEKLRLETICL